MAQQCLRGIAIGDAFGESFFGETKMVVEHLAQRKIPSTTWEFTDDTIMAIAIYQELIEKQTIEQDALAQRWAHYHNIDPNRGYGATARRILRGIAEGKCWAELSKEVFDGMGSMGNGAAMRVGPIGAYYYDNIEQVKALASTSAVITHAHKEAKVGTMAIAIATALATQIRLEKASFSPTTFITTIVNQLPDSDTTSKINKALYIGAKAHPETLKTVLGNGHKMTAQDTVPFVIWCAAHHLNNFEEALWKAVAVLGDRDTIAAMVGGIVALSSPSSTIPSVWKKEVEAVEESVFMKVKF